MRRWHGRELLGGVLIMMMTACTGVVDESTSLDGARSEVESLVVDLQEAFVLEEQLVWEGPSNHALAQDDEGQCRWRPGEWSTTLTLPEGDPTWAERRERVNEVLEQHNLEAVGEPDYTGGSAYGFETAAPAGGVLRIDSWKGTTTIYLHGLSVAVDGACDDSSLPI